MKLKEEKGNLFEIDDKYYLVHCISADYALGAGIAVEFEKRFKLKQMLKTQKNIYPNCIPIGKVFNLVTKAKYWHKPTYDSLKLTLIELCNFVTAKNIKYIAMPKIGCGLDRLKWDEVKSIITTVFASTDVEILVKYL